MKKLTLYNIYKFKSTYLAENNFICNISYDKAMKNKYVVGIGDSQMTRHLEDLGCVKYKKCKNGKVTKFIDDIISVQFDDIKHHTKIRKKALTKKDNYGFIVNGKKFTRLLTSAGSGRKSTSFFVNVDIKDKIVKLLMNGLNMENMVADPAKFNAYFAISSSSSHVVTSPRCVVIDDFEINQEILVDFVNSDSTVTENKTIVVNKNCFDGQGLIDPEFAKIWAKDLDCDYLPFGWVIRNSFLKGAVFNFDFKLWARENNISSIKDVYGKTYFVDDIDVILTKSQFKMKKFYDSWEHYIKCCDKNNNKWSVTKINLEEESEYSTTNYQFLQTLNLSKEDIKKLAEYSVEEIKSSFNDINKAIELLDFDKDKPSYVQALEVCPEAINDPYISAKIWNNVSHKIDEMCIGKIKVRGNYQFMIADPVAFVEWAFYRNIDKVNGSLKKGEYYSNYWLDRNIKQVSAIRSPNIHFSEHNLLNLVDKNSWFRHLPMGIIYNIWGNDCIKHQGSDYDGDCVFTTDNETMRNGIIDCNIIEFNHSSPEEKLLTEELLYKADARGFSISIGSVVNLATNVICRLSEFNVGTPEHNELLKRIKVISAVSQLTIDAQKGIEIQKIPSAWKKFRPIVSFERYRYKSNNKCLKLCGKSLDELEKLENGSGLSEFEDMFLKEYKRSIPCEDTEEAVNEKEYNNGLLIGSEYKPYFLIHKDAKLKQAYKKYTQTLTSNVPANNPVNESDSVMNILCKYIESYKFELKRQIKSETISNEWYNVMRNRNMRKVPQNYDEVLKIYNEYTATKQYSYTDSYSENEDIYKNINTVDRYFKDRFMGVVKNESELANYLIEILYKKYPKREKRALWEFAGDAVVKNLKNNMEEFYGVHFERKILC